MCPRFAAPKGEIIGIRLDASAAAWGGADHGFQPLCRTISERIVKASKFKMDGFQGIRRGLPTRKRVNMRAVVAVRF